MPRGQVARQEEWRTVSDCESDRRQYDATLPRRSTRAHAKRVLVLLHEEGITAHRGFGTYDLG